MAFARGPRIFRSAFILLFCLVLDIKPGLARHQQTQNFAALPEVTISPPEVSDGLRVPLWSLLIRYAEFGIVANRAAQRAALRRRRRQRREGGSGGRQPNTTGGLPAYFPLLPLVLRTHRPPLERVLWPSQNAALAGALITTLKGAGAYLALILLCAMDVESNPGPMDEETIRAILKEGLETFRESFKAEIRATIKEEMVKTNEELEHIHTRIFGMENHIGNLMDENKMLLKRIGDLERRERRKNIVIFGIPDAEDSNAALERVAKDIMGFPSAPPVDTIYRIGKKAGKRPILACLRLQRDKEALMQKVASLKGSGIVLSDDLSPEEQAVRRTIVEAVKHARAEGLDAKVRRTGALVDGRLVPAERLAHPDWLTKIRGSERQSEQEERRPRQPRPPERPPANRNVQQQRRDKRPFSETVTPPGAREVRREGDECLEGAGDDDGVFARPRSPSPRGSGEEGGSSRSSSRGSNNSKKLKAGAKKK